VVGKVDHRINGWGKKERLVDGEYVEPTSDEMQW